MLYLAQVKKKETLWPISLRLLAYHKPDDTWAVITDKNAAFSGEAILEASFVNTFSDGVLVLVDIGDNHEILSIQDATNWVLNFVQQYLTKDITPNFLEEEAEKAEQWRQTLTLQSQELSRRAIEIEARREQIQTLEEKLQREKHLLEIMAAKLKKQSN